MTCTSAGATGYASAVGDDVMRFYNLVVDYRSRGRIRAEETVIPSPEIARRASVDIDAVKIADRSAGPLTDYALL